ncbi:hypothetical protein [Sutterella sp.]|uniref:hypothetical protein n=1 Tax=Sutterella sp. TaxID=1981025 RepID=UPI0026E09F29|nr:hypothetical protein [Sutterella sp.]MDO5531330.1 hypothetical protein [Sutterella sp.]
MGTMKAIDSAKIFAVLGEEKIRSDEPRLFTEDELVRCASEPSLFSDPPAEKPCTPDGGRKPLPEDVKHKARQIFDLGCGYKRASLLLNVTQSTVRDWNRLYKAGKFNH